MIARNRDHDRSESVITIVRNPHSVGLVAFIAQKHLFSEPMNWYLAAIDSQPLTALDLGGFSEPGLVPS